MPRKKREVRRDYRRAGSWKKQVKAVIQRDYRHPSLQRNYAVAGHDGEDAKRYDDDNLREALMLLEEAKQEGGQA